MLCSLDRCPHPHPAGFHGQQHQYPSLQMSPAGAEGGPLPLGLAEMGQLVITFAKAMRAVLSSSLANKVSFCLPQLRTWRVA